MKKEARIQAEKMFLKAGGKITNREIAEATKVNALTIGRWKRENDWEAKLKGEEEQPKEMGGVVRKKAARDKAIKLYLDADGNITNKDLAKRVGVSPATISKWKLLDNWIEKIEPEEEGIEEIEQPETDLDMGELASPEQIIRLNRRIDSLLERDYLTASEVAALAEAKSDLLAAVEIYLSIVREVGDIREQE
ncbi:phage terminase small subunit-related protein [Desulfomonile tiedjei]|uniref:Archaeal/vacuolar-type H+-ATPase subunit I n=1 Tax=Desulfomonile tiedjei (strain ATCC 49306 / DSM 6799 / DCB-1) TaxID=706587 RepID=I4CBF0_DESTA|nr:phage terminase small subunit-related protein [Desulfomonile tiedjei]AFM26891.1 archaeal/vacuolar-type H+-ATPase subunit I [Desulfomonile tiedjei DSM 6799]